MILKAFLDELIRKPVIASTAKQPRGSGALMPIKAISLIIDSILNRKQRQDRRFYHWVASLCSQ